MKALLILLGAMALAVVLPLALLNLALRGED